MAIASAWSASLGRRLSVKAKAMRGDGYDSYEAESPIVTPPDLDCTASFAC